MESQSRFDLNAAIRDWQQALDTQPGLAPEDRRELESHLRDSMAELQQRGLNGEEAFWLARRRVGPPQRLGEEFGKANPVRVWRERLFWMALVLLIQRFWADVTATAEGVLGHCLPDSVVWLNGPGKQSLPQVMLIGSLFFYLPFIALAVAVARGQAGHRGASARRFFLRSRWRFLCVATILVLGTQLSRAYVDPIFGPKSLAPFMRQAFYTALITSVGLIVVLTWFLPPQANTPSTRTEAA
jgi:hypothetical protein